MPVGGRSKRVKLPPNPKVYTQKLYENFLTFNQCNEFAYKYDLASLCDKRSDSEGTPLISEWISQKLKYKSFYLETSTERYELSSMARQERETENDIFEEEHDIYRLARLKQPFSKDNEFFSKHDVPLKNDFIQVSLLSR